MTPTKQQDEMWVEVLRWMGWTHIGYSPGYGYEGYSPENELNKVEEPQDGPMDSIPRLTLDALHEAEAKLFASDNPVLSSPQPSDTYAYHLELIVLGRQLWSNGASTLAWGDVQKLIHASKEQRLLALWRTVRGSPSKTADTGPLSQP